MAARLTDRFYKVEWLSALVTAKFPKRGQGGPYRPRQPKVVKTREFQTETLPGQGNRVLIPNTPIT